MSEAQQPIKDASVALEENARIGYQAAVDLCTYEADHIWTRFNVMLVANSIVMAVIGLALTSQRAVPVLTVGLPIAGLVLCALWFLLMERGFDYQTYYVLSARELEELYLVNPVKTLSRGASFANGEEVSLRIGGTSITRRMSIWGRLLRGRQASYLTIMVFAILYVCLWRTS